MYGGFPQSDWRALRFGNLPGGQATVSIYALHRFASRRFLGGVPISSSRIAEPVTRRAAAEPFGPTNGGLTGASRTDLLPAVVDRGVGPQTKRTARLISSRSFVSLAAHEHRVRTDQLSSIRRYPPQEQSRHGSGGVCRATFRSSGGSSPRRTLPLRGDSLGDRLRRNRARVLFLHYGRGRARS